MAENQLPAYILEGVEDLKTNPPNLDKKKQRSTARNGQLHGSTSVDSDVESSSNTVAFKIGDETIHVPEMTWAIIEEVMPMLEEQSDPMAKWYHTKVRDFEIFLKAVAPVRPDLTLEYIKARLTLRQANDLSTKLIDLLQLSGFNVPSAGDGVGEAGAAMTPSSTETLIVSSQDLSAEDAQELLSGTK